MIDFVNYKVDHNTGSILSCALKCNFGDRISVYFGYQRLRSALALEWGLAFGSQIISQKSDRQVRVNIIVKRLKGLS